MAPANRAAGRERASAAGRPAADPARRDHGSAVAARTSARPARSGPPSVPSARSRSRPRPPRRRPASSDQRLAALDAGSLDPTPHCDLAAPDVEPDGDRLPGGEPRTSPGPRARRCRPRPGPRRRRTGRGRVGVAHASPVCTGHGDGGRRWPRSGRGSPARRCGRRRGRRRGSTARRRPRTPRPLHRVVAVDGLAVVVALDSRTQRPPRRSIAG